MDVCLVGSRVALQLEKQMTRSWEDPFRGHGVCHRHDMMMAIFPAVLKRKLFAQTLFLLLHAEIFTDHISHCQRYHWLQKAIPGTIASSLPISSIHTINIHLRTLFCAAHTCLPSSKGDCLRRNWP